MNADLYLLVGEGELHWGFSVRSRGATARQKALIAPPPTSLVGALLFPLARLMGWGELPLSPVRNAVIGAYASISPLIEFEDLMRSLALPYLQRRYRSWKMRDYWFSVFPLGKAYGPATKLRLAYLISGELLEKHLGSGWKDLIRASLASITRIGSKESIVSMDPRTEIGKARITLKGRGKTYFYAPLKALRSFSPSSAWIEEFWDNNGLREEYVLNVDDLRSVQVSFELSEDGFMAEMGNYTVVGMRSWLNDTTDKVATKR